jgi:mRNA-degrading endonuclease HigB of HigAB toxin-antitoxin module
MRINKQIIEKLKPCQDRFDNFKKHYSDFDDDLKEFILLENISYSDKVWVFTRLATKMQNVKWSLLCASKVLHLFEEKYPNDKRPRKALEFVENWINNPSDASAYASAAASAAASSAADAAADFAAAYAASAAFAAAAASAAAYASAAASAAAYASSAASSAAFAAASASAARTNEEELNLLMMIEAIK